MKVFAGLYAVVLIILVAMAAGLLIDGASRWPLVKDISSAGRNSLNPRTTALLEQLDDPLIITAVLPANHPARGGVEQYFLAYQRTKADLELAFFDPRENPDQARLHGARPGEMVFEYQGRKEILQTLTEPAVVNVLARLSRAGDRYISFLNGNGERQITREANHDMSAFAAYLEQRGLKLRELTLGQITDIPANTAVLVIASPRLAYATGDVAAIARYVDAGGNLLWLIDPDTSAGLDTLASQLGIAQLAGTVIDPVGLTKFGNPAYAVAAYNDPHAVTEGFQQTVVFPFATALMFDTNSRWQTTALARSGDAAWTETGNLEGNVGFDSDDEIQASHYLALALERKSPAQGSAAMQQRVGVIGDGDFISNSFVENLGNREFAGRLVEWLAHDDNLIQVQVDAVADPTLDLEMWQRLLMFMVFGVGIPVSLLANGLLYAWRRRNA